MFTTGSLLMLGFGKCIMTLWLGLRLLFYLFSACLCSVLLLFPAFFYIIWIFFKFPFNLSSSSLVMVLCIISWLLLWPCFTACLEHCSTTCQGRTCRSVNLHVMAIMHISPACITNSRHVLIFFFKYIFHVFFWGGESCGMQDLSYPIWHWVSAPYIGSVEL